MKMVTIGGMIRKQIKGIFHGQLEAIIENKSIVAFIVFMRH